MTSLEEMTLNDSTAVLASCARPWLSEKFAPHLQDIGPGIGCLKVIGNTQFSFPLCPGAAVLPPQHDPVRKSWLPHKYSPVEPPLAPCSGLELVRRDWQPGDLISEFRLDGMDIRQRATVFDYGAAVRLEGQGLKALILDGASFGPCKLRVDKNGLHVVEVSPRLRPMAYTIRFYPDPQIELVDASHALTSEFGYFDDGARWRFSWPDTPSSIDMEVKVFRDGTFRTLDTLDVSTRLQNARKAWERFYEEAAPRLRTPDERINRICDYFSYVFRSNGVQRQGLLSHPYSMPKQTFCGWWMWDSCFHTISGCWSAERELAWGCLLNIENVQYPPGTHGAGTVTNQAFPHGVDVFKSDAPMAGRLACMPHLLPAEHGDGTHPPIFAQALHALWSTEGNNQNMRRLLPNALAYHDWFERRRRSETLPGLLLVRRWSDSGMDNSPRWGREGSGIYGTGITEADWGIPMVTVDLNVYSVLEKRCLAAMLRAAGEAQKAGQFEKEAADREALIHAQLWDAQKGLYMDRNEQGGAFIPVMSPTGFYPLLLGGLDEKRLDRMLEHLFDEKKFWAKMPIPSAAMDDPHFKADHSYWAGDTWMNYTVYILRGLFQKRPEAGWKLLDRVLDGLYTPEGPVAFENFNPLTGQGYDAADFGWAGMITDVIIRDMLCIEPTADGLTLGTPRVPESWKYFEATNLFCGGPQHVSAHRTGEGWVVDMDRSTP